MLKKILAGALASACVSAAASAAGVKVDSAFLAQEHIDVFGDLVLAMRTEDKLGKHILVLSQKKGPSHDKEMGDPTQDERIDLRAVFYTRENDAWRSAWTIVDFNDCPTLDAEASFFDQQVWITDVNNDGVDEVTVPYRMFCGGGVDPSTIKVIMRQGELKLAIRGESLIKMPGNAPFGGDKTYDKALQLPENAAFKKQLDAVWKAVYVQQY
jgi:hypothetical protein